MLQEDAVFFSGNLFTGTVHFRGTILVLILVYLWTFIRVNDSGKGVEHPRLPLRLLATIP